MPGEEPEAEPTCDCFMATCSHCPGKKLMFMGDEFGQWKEWTHATSLDWHLLDDPRHRGLKRWVRDLNTQYRAEPALHELDCRTDGFAWIEADNASDGVLVFLRMGSTEHDQAVVVCNFSGQVYRNYPRGGSRGAGAGRRSSTATP